MKKILQKDAPVLRKTAEDVPLDQIGSKELNKVIEDMKEALDSQDDGVAIAAPQIGYSLRIFVVSKKVGTIMMEEKEIANGLSPEETSTKIAVNELGFEDLVFINPVIKKISKERKFVEEGCLSVRYLYGKVSRAKKVKIEAYDENGKKFERGGTGLLAQIFQHETDHLDGVLFIDKAKDLEDLPPEKLKSQKSNAK
ncbi:MAG: peptide deformylase [Candidatus Pacebacteria bacterium]|nr:peptide deformylase [Candidatus Paceibacterota bacterium]